jgi:hypothetical protein
MGNWPLHTAASYEMSESGIRPAFRGSVAMEEITFPIGPPRSVGAVPARPLERAAQRFDIADAELRTRGARRHMTIGLRDTTGRLLLLVLWSQERARILRGRYRLAAPEAEALTPVVTTAYLTSGQDWHCLGSPRAVGGRVVLTWLNRDKAQGAFDVTFPQTRLHGAFVAERRSSDEEDL